MASENCPTDPKKVQLEASRRLLCAGTPPKKWAHAQTDLEVEYFYNLDDKSDDILLFCHQVHFEIGLGRDHFWQGVGTK